jgi:hypothetical protein
MSADSERLHAEYERLGPVPDEDWRLLSADLPRALARAETMCDEGKISVAELEALKVFVFSKKRLFN